MNGRETLQKAVNLLGNCRESFNDRFTAEQALLLYRAYAACGWDITPDEWSDSQIADALVGKVPVFLGFREAQEAGGADGAKAVQTALDEGELDLDYPPECWDEAARNAFTHHHRGVVEEYATYYYEAYEEAAQRHVAWLQANREDRS